MRPTGMAMTMSATWRVAICKVRPRGGLSVRRQAGRGQYRATARCREAARGGTRSAATGADQLGETRQIDVAAADEDADALAGKLARHPARRREGERTGRLDDHL